MGKKSLVIDEEKRLEAMMSDENPCIRMSAMRFCNWYKAPMRLLKKGLEDDDRDVRKEAVAACRTYYIKLSIIHKWLRSSNYDAVEAILKMCNGWKVCNGHNVSLATIKRWLRSQNSDVRRAALHFCFGRKDVPLDLILAHLDDAEWRNRYDALEACVGRDVPVWVVVKGLTDKIGLVHEAALHLCIGRKDVPSDLLMAALGHELFSVRSAARAACNGPAERKANVFLAGRDPNKV